ncbi:MAG: molecular chaperone DnaK, partial [bacterium]
ERARKALRGDDLNEIKAAQEELSKSFGEAGQSFYAQNQAAESAANTGGEQASGQQADGAGGAKPADDVVEADYEIVDDKK